MGDTIVGNKLTHKLVQSNYNYEGELVYETEHYVFQESDTVFLYSIPKSDFLVFYIFNRNQGDTITLDAPYTIPGLGSKYRLVIDSVSTVVIDNTPLQKYKTSALDEYSLQGQGYFMDRIGGLTWFSPTPITGIPEGPGPIRCYSDLQVDTNFQTYNWDYRLSSALPSPPEVSNINIYPNPVDDAVFVDSEYPIEKLSLFQLDGKLLISGHNNSIDISTLPKGCYILLITLESGKMFRKKIVKS